MAALGDRSFRSASASNALHSAFAASVAIHLLLLALLAALDGGRPPAVVLIDPITATLAPLAGRIAADVRPPAARSDSETPSERTSPVVARRERAAAAPAAATTASAVPSTVARVAPSLPVPATASAGTSVTPDDDIADAGQYRMAFAFAMRRAASASGAIHAAERLRVVVHVAFDAGGALAGVDVVRSSGMPAIDERAVALVRSASADLPVPIRLRGAPIGFDVAIDVAVDDRLTAR